MTTLSLNSIRRILLIGFKIPGSIKLSSLSYDHGLKTKPFWFKVSKTIVMHIKCWVEQNLKLSHWACQFVYTDFWYCKLHYPSMVINVFLKRIVQVSRLMTSLYTFF